MLGNVLGRSHARAINRSIAWYDNTTCLRNHYRGAKLCTIWHLCVKFIMSPRSAPLYCPDVYHCHSIMYSLHSCLFFHVSLCLVCYVYAFFSWGCFLLRRLPLFLIFWGHAFAARRMVPPCFISNTVFRLMVPELGLFFWIVSCFCVFVFVLCGVVCVSPGFECLGGVTRGFFLLFAAFGFL